MFKGTGTFSPPYFIHEVLIFSQNLTIHRRKKPHKEQCIQQSMTEQTSRSQKICTFTRQPKQRVMRNIPFRVGETQHSRIQSDTISLQCWLLSFLTCSIKSLQAFRSEQQRERSKHVQGIKKKLCHLIIFKARLSEWPFSMQLKKGLIQAFKSESRSY